MTTDKGTDTKVALILDIIRYQGEVCEYIGIATKDYEEGDQAELDRSLNGLDTATEALRKILYDEAGVK